MSSDGWLQWSERLTKGLFVAWISSRRLLCISMIAARRPACVELLLSEVSGEGNAPIAPA